MEQPKKPAAGPQNISDLKARLGLLKGPPPGGAPPPGAAIPPPAGAPVQPLPPVGSGGVPAPVASAAAAPPTTSSTLMDPYAGMRPAAGQQFDLRPVDDGIPVENVRTKGSVASLITTIVLVLIAAGIGIGFGAASVGRRAFNAANAAAKTIKTELETINKAVTQIGTAFAMSQQRLAAARKDPSDYDPELVAALSEVKLDPRPDTSRIFKSDYSRMEDMAVDRLMNYYYDAISLYAELERHLKRTTADKDVLEAQAARTGGKAEANYGVVFESRGKLAIGSLVELGLPVCPDGGNECPGDQIVGFQIRSNTGAPWTARKIGPRPEGDKVVPLDKTPLAQAVMAGSPEQVRVESYRQRMNTMRILLARLTQEKKQLQEAIDRAASRSDLFTF